MYCRKVALIICIVITVMQLINDEHLNTCRQLKLKVY